MSASSIVKTKRDAEIMLGFLGGGAFQAANGNPIVGPPAARTFTIIREPGDFSFSVPRAAKNHFLDRGQFGTPPQVRYGDDQAITGSFSAYLTEITDATAAVLLDIAHETGWAASTLESVFDSAPAAADHEVFGCDIRYRVTNQGNAADVHTLVFRYCTLEIQTAEGDPDKVTVNWTCHQVAPAYVF